MVIDFGNGITASTDGLPGILRGHVGLDVPDIELAISENGVGDGGIVGPSRSKTRRMTVPVIHDRTWTRSEIARAFTPGVERTLSSPLGSMPYYVEALSFPSDDIAASHKFTVTLTSPLAYPEAALVTLTGAAAAYQFDTLNPVVAPWTLVVPPSWQSSRGTWHKTAWQSITVASGEKFSNVTLLESGYSGLPYTVELKAVVGGLPSGDAIVTQTGHFNAHMACLYGVYSLPSGTYAAVFTFDVPSSDYPKPLLYSARGNPYSGGQGGHGTRTEYIAGDGTDTSMDWLFTVKIGTPVATQFQYNTVSTAPSGTSLYSDAAPYPYTRAVWESFYVGDGQTINRPRFYMNGVQGTVTFDIFYADTNGIPFGESLHHAQLTGLGTTANYIEMPGAPFVVPSGGMYAVLAECPSSEQYPLFRYDPSAPYAGGKAGHLKQYLDGTKVFAEGIAADSTIDWDFKVDIGVPVANTTYLSFESTTEVPTPATVTAVISASIDELLITSGGKLTRIIGPLMINDIVVIDSEAHTVTVNGQSAQSKFDRAHEWPLVYPGTQDIVVTPSVGLSVAWKPRLMGLI